MVRAKEPGLGARFRRRVVDREHEPAYALVDGTSHRDWRRGPSPEECVLPLGGQAREGRRHAGEQQRGGSTSEDGERELEIPYAVGRCVREPRLDTRDDV